MTDDEIELPPSGHPLNVLATRLGELLDEDHWAECEGLLLKACAERKKERAAMEDLAMLVKKLVRSIRLGVPELQLADRAMDYLKRNGLEGSPLRHNSSYSRTIQGNEMDISAITVEAQKLTLKPGDILALRVDRILSMEQIERMRDGLEQIRPDGVKIAILDSTCQLQIVESPPAP